jgi:hypothetical protein
MAPVLPMKIVFVIAGASAANEATGNTAAANKVADAIADTKRGNTDFDITGLSEKRAETTCFHRYQKNDSSAK